MAITFNDNMGINAPKHIDARSMNFTGGVSAPYTSVAAANAAVLSAYRHQYLTCWVTLNGDPIEHWWRASTADGSLEPKWKDSWVLNADGSVALPVGYRVKGIVVLPTNTISNLLIGTAPGGSDLEPGSGSITGGTGSYDLAYSRYIVSATNIYFTGITNNTKVLVFKEF